MSEVSIFEGKHMISIMMYVGEHDGCMKTDVYRGVARNPRMSDKLDILTDEGLIVQRPDGNAVRLHLTDRGRRTVTALRDLSLVVSG